jgi:RNA polymerase-binding transcription factor DksA
MIDIEFYKKQLEDDLAVITKELQSLGIHNPQVKEDWIALPDSVGMGESDDDLLADRTEDWEERVATLAALETQWGDINRALRKIENGTYGVCEISGEEIEEERLNANPSARTCKAHMDDEQDLPA